MVKLESTYIYISMQYSFAATLKVRPKKFSRMLFLYKYVFPFRLFIRTKVGPDGVTNEKTQIKGKYSSSLSSKTQFSRNDSFNFYIDEQTHK